MSLRSVLSPRRLFTDPRAPLPQLGQESRRGSPSTQEAAIIRFHCPECQLGDREVGHLGARNTESTWCLFCPKKRGG